MRQFTNTEEINKIVRQKLIEQSSIPAELVRDATTLYGAFLNKNTQASIFESVEHSDTILLFELETSTSSSNMSRTNDDGSVIYDRSYRMKITMYGDNSGNVANTLIARLRTEKVRNELLAQGVYIENVTDCTEIHDFKNTTVWLRNDFEINLACEIIIDQSSDDHDYTSFKKINVIRSI